MPTAIGRGGCFSSWRVGWAKALFAPCPPFNPTGRWWARFALPTLRWLVSNPLDDGRGAHAAADAQGHQRGLFVGALEFVEHGAEDHRAGGAERMAERDG